MDQLDAVRATYDTDFVLWMERQAELLRAQKFDELDVDNIVDELEAAVRADRRELGVHLKVIVYCLLSQQFRPLHKPRARVAPGHPMHSARDPPAAECFSSALPCTPEQLLDQDFVP